MTLQCMIVSIQRRNDMLEWVLSLMGTKCQCESTSPVNCPERVIIIYLSLVDPLRVSCQKWRKPSRETRGTSLPPRPVPKAVSMKHTASSISSCLVSVHARAQIFYASPQIPITSFDDSASFCLRTMPMRRRAPRMKCENHFPKVCPIKTYRFFWSSPTTVLQEKFSPAS